MSDGEGTFEFERCLATDDDLRIFVAGAKGCGTSETFRLMPGGDESDLQVRLQPAGIIEGRVTDENDDPIAGAVVRLSQVWRGANRSGSGSRGTLLTDRKGRYRHLGLAPGTYKVSLSESKTHQPGIAPEFEIRIGQTHREDIVIERN